MKTKTLRARATRLLSISRYTLATSPAMALLVDFAAQNSGIERANYYDGRDPNREARRQGRAAFHQEQRSISADWRRFVEAFHAAAAEGVTDAQLIAAAPGAFSGRLEWKDGAWHYTTGQYFCTEYRKAAAALIEYATRDARRARPATKQVCTTIAEVQAPHSRRFNRWNVKQISQGKP